MQVSKKTLVRWRKLRDKNDVKNLAQITGKSPETMSRILSGKQETSSDVLLAIKEFYKARKLKVAIIEDDQN